MKEYICSYEIILKSNFLNKKIRASSKEEAIDKFIKYIKNEYNMFVFSSSINIIDIDEVEVIE